MFCHSHRYIHCSHNIKLKCHVPKTLHIFVCFKIEEVYIVITSKKKHLLAVVLSVRIFLKNISLRFRSPWGGRDVILKIILLVWLLNIPVNQDSISSNFLLRSSLSLHKSRHKFSGTWEPLMVMPKGKTMSLKKLYTVEKQVFWLFLNKSGLERVFFIADFCHFMHKFPYINKPKPLENAGVIHVTKY